MTERHRSFVYLAQAKEASGDEILPLEVYR